MTRCSPPPQRWRCPELESAPRRHVLNKPSPVGVGSRRYAHRPPADRRQCGYQTGDREKQATVNKRSVAPPLARVRRPGAGTARRQNRQRSCRVLPANVHSQAGLSHVQAAGQSRTRPMPRIDLERALFRPQVSARFPPPGLHEKLVNNDRRRIVKVAEKSLSVFIQFGFVQQSARDDLVANRIDQRDQMRAAVIAGLGDADSHFDLDILNAGSRSKPGKRRPMKPSPPPAWKTVWKALSRTSHEGCGG